MKYSFWILLIVSCVWGCSDSPSSVGGSYGNTNIEFKSYTLKPTEFEIVSKAAEVSNSNTEYSQEVLVGTSQDGTVAHGLFYLYDTIQIKGSKLENRSITDVSISLRSNKYRYGDTASHEANFDVVVIPQSLAGNARWNDTTVAKIQDATVLGSFSGTFTDSTAINIALDKTLATKFLSEYRKDSSLKQMLCLRAKSNGKNIIGIWGASGNAGSVNDSLIPRLKVSFGDTTVSLKIGASNWIAKLPVLPSPNRIVFGGGESIRTLIKFRLDSIPKNAVIHKAELTLTVDTTNSKFGSYKLTRYLVGYAATDSSIQNLKAGSVVATSRRASKDSLTYLNTFSFPALGAIISDWLLYERGAGNQKNNGVIFALNRSLVFDAPLEVLSVDRLICFGSDATEPTNRPKLVITYSLSSEK